MSGRASQRESSAPASTATTRPMTRASRMRRMEPCAWASTLSRGRARTSDPPPRFALISISVSPAGPRIVVDTLIPAAPSRTSRGGSNSAAGPLGWPSAETTPASVAPRARLTRSLRSLREVLAGSFESSMAWADSCARAWSIDDWCTSCSEMPPVTSTASVATAIVTRVTRPRSPSERRVTSRRPPQRIRRPGRCGSGSAAPAWRAPGRRARRRCGRSRSPPGPRRSTAAPRA